jgi:hypothetical protein
MANELRPSDAELDALTSTLKDGLQSCRSVVRHYREMLSAEQPPNPGLADAANGKNSLGCGGNSRNG